MAGLKPRGSSAPCRAWSLVAWESGSSRQVLRGRLLSPGDRPILPKSRPAARRQPLAVGLPLSPGDAFGACLAVLPDLDGDQVSELAVCAQGSSVDPATGKRTDGSVFVLFMARAAACNVITRTGQSSLCIVTACGQGKVLDLRGQGRCVWHAPL